MNQWVHPVSCHQFFLEKERVSRTKRAMRWHRVLYQRSMCAVSPVSLPDTAVSLLREHRHVGLPEVAKAVALAISPRHPLPSARQASPPQPPPKAATWWVLRHIAVQGPRLSLCRHTNDQASSSSITSKDSHFNSSYLQYFRLSSAFNLRSVTNRLPPNQTSRTWVPLPDIRRASSP